MRALESTISKQRGLSRRQVLRAGAVMSAAASIPAFPSLAAAAPRRLPRFRRSSYLRLSVRNRTFYGRQVGSARWSRMRLVVVGDLPSAQTVSTLRRHEHAFALQFEGPAGGTQQTYEFRHARFGRFHLFMSPAGTRPDGRQRYEALIDRSHGPTREHPAPRRAAA